MRPDWNHLAHATAAAQRTFLETEVDTGITLARIAVKATDRKKSSRNARSARKAYDTLASYLAELSPETRGLDGIRKKMVILQDLLEQLRDKH